MPCGSASLLSLEKNVVEPNPLVLKAVLASQNCLGAFPAGNAPEVV